MSVIRGKMRNVLEILQIHKFNLLAVVNSIDGGKGNSDPFSEFTQFFEILGRRAVPGIFKNTLRELTEPYRLCAWRAIPAGFREQVKQEVNKNCCCLYAV